ncbi:glyoxalase superfamily protein [Arenibacterium sp. CAU 1754]
MTNLPSSPRVEAFKAQARRLRTQLAGTGTDISHSQALELVAQQQGARDWNTLRALASRPGNNRPLAVGDRVTGHYLGQPFTGYVHGLSHGEHGDHSRITLHFDDPVDVVTFDSFSSFRQRVSATIGPDGRSPRKTSNGEPQIIVEFAGL